MTDTTPAARQQRTNHATPHHRPSPRNVGDVERWASILGGGTLVLLGLTRRTPGALGLALLGGGLLYRGATGHCPLYGALGVNTAGHHPASTAVPAGEGVKVTRSILVLRPAAELYRYWRNFENLPRIMRHLESVEMTSSHRSRWVARGPLGMRFEWDADIISEKENELIGWRSLEGSAVETAGSVHFLPARGGQATEVKVVLKYNPPAGKVGAAIARLLGDSPEQQIEEDLRTFKWVMEIGRLASMGQFPTS
jgi:uncharacterized membrane protein